MGAVDSIRRHRLSLAVLVLLQGLLLLAYWIIAVVRLGTGRISLSWRSWVEIVLTIVLFGSYAYSISRAATVPRQVRALVLSFLAVFLIALRIEFLARLVEHGAPFLCGLTLSIVETCVIDRMLTFLEIIVGIFVLLEVVLTFRNASLAHKAAQDHAKNTVLVSPDQPPMLLQQVQYPYQPQLVVPQQQHHQQHLFCPQQELQPQQPYGLQPYPGQHQQVYGYDGQMQQLQHHPHQLYHPHLQQPPPPPPPPPQQPNPYTAGYGITPIPMVTTTPQPGDQPIAPYPSPGFSIAASPILPEGGYLTPSDSMSPQPQPQQVHPA